MITARFIIMAMHVFIVVCMCVCMELGPLPSSQLCAYVCVLLSVTLFIISTTCV